MVVSRSNRPAADSVSPPLWGRLGGIDWGNDCEWSIVPCLSGAIDFDCFRSAVIELRDIHATIGNVRPAGVRQRPHPAMRLELDGDSLHEYLAVFPKRAIFKHRYSSIIAITWVGWQAHAGNRPSLTSARNARQEAHSGPSHGLR